MRKYILVMIATLLLGSVKAQENTAASLFNNYKHTLTFYDHKINFQLQPIKQLPKITDPSKRYYWYSNNQIEITQGGYSGKLLNGLYTDFHFNNNLKEQGLFKMGLKTGEWKKWTIEGTLSEVVHFDEGVPHGSFYQYNLLGELSESGHYKNGKIHGTLKKYIKRDSIVISQYKNGVILLAQPNWLKRQFEKKQKPVLSKI